MAGNMTGVLCDSPSPPTALHPAPSGPRPEHCSCCDGGSGGGVHSRFPNKSPPVAGRNDAPVVPDNNDDQVEASTSTDARATNLDATTAPVLASTSTRSSHKANHARDSDISTASASLSVVAAASSTPGQEEAIDPSTSAAPVPAFVPSIVGASAGGSSPSSLSPSIAAPTPPEPTSVLVHTSRPSPSSSPLDLSVATTTTASPLPLSSDSKIGHRRNTPSRDSIPRQTVIKALASVVRHRKPEALSLEHSHSHSRARRHSRSQSKSKSLSILYGMLPPKAGDNSQSLAPAEFQLSQGESTTSPVSSAGASAADLPPAPSPGTPTQNETQTLTDTLNDIAMSRLSPAVATPVATTPTPTTATLSNTHLASSNTASSKPGAATSPATPATATAANMSAAGGGGFVPASATVNPLLLPSTLQSPCFYHERFADAVDIGKVLEEIKNDVSMSHSRLVATATGVREVSKQLQRRPIRRAVRNIMIVTKARDNQLVYLTRELASWLLRTPRYGSDLGVNVYVDAKLRNSRRFDAAGILAENPRFQHMLKYWTPDLCWSQPEKFDLVLTLGGDGTVLFTSWLFQRIVPPVLSFSLGSLGFMTTFEFEKYKEHLNRVMGDDGMKINLRMRFTCTVYRGGLLGGPHLEEGEQFEVLNELVIDRGPSPYVSNLELYGDDELLTVVQADGCIFSTPTGSTAYSLSAGGALVHPDIPAILLTPICPHTLSFRPMVLSDTMALRVSIPRNSRATAYCAFDGKGRLELRQGDHVTITASQYPFPTVTRTDTEWFDSVSRTLRWNVRAAAQKPFDDGALAENNDDQDDLGWDIDTDSAFYGSEEGSVSASPIRRQMSLLGL